MGVFESIDGLSPALILLLDLACTIIGGAILTFIIVKLLRKLLKKSSHVDDAMSVFIVNVIKVACIIIIVAMALQFLGVSASTIVAVLGAAGAAIALALKDSLANIAGGFMILVTHPFGKGDLISVGENRGYVEEIDLFLTTLRTFDRRTITIPNGLINTAVVYNESNREIRRIDCKFSISYDADIDAAKDVIKSVRNRSKLILDFPEPIIGVKEHGDNGITLDAFAYCKTEDIWDAKYYFEEHVKKAFDEAGIEIPYPHIDVNVVKD